ncbi:thiamine pyrophosphate-dependent dehydrogenase E1 component subunit alpha [Micromonospora sp. AMSO12t]|uniref:thiamine pyrophosphate-dependent dehydrogenase E1 component subunit alpha n=1 Tax=Micromonospora sp. AMSO12t TaxID=2650410 RepID=UPI00124B2BA4|nr:thiamine pyrophosphate-dependent dehydrogenase E1 component subunit alpha [Micromonospora sp. AMSO12t]KAB1161896.1 thiamine pyrophosphate-dependent dehydrogenase E1 component subunit alpha [Micromonospora sp. AMSO12t]
MRESRLRPLADSTLGAMLSIRRFEYAVLDLLGRGLIPGTSHTCLGQEYVPVVVESLLRPDDEVFSNHRGHGHFLARYDDPAGLLAELAGREGALCGGMGGSQHIRRPGFMSTGIQGQLVPVAVGTAFDMRRTGTNSISVVYVGDGTWGEGVVYEALNLAALWRVPMVVVVEHNGIAQSTPTSAQMAGSVADRCAAFGIRHVEMTGIDVDAIRASLAPLVAAVRHDGSPLVVEFDTVRLGPHSKGDDTRTPAELEALAGRDWYPHYRAAFPEQVDRLDAAATGKIRDVVESVLARPLIGAGHG